MIECTRCKTRKPASDFRRDGRKKNGLSSWCRLCGNAASLASHHKHKATRPSKLAYIRQWYADRSDEQRMVDRVRGVVKRTGASRAAVEAFLLRFPPIARCQICDTKVAVRPHLTSIDTGPVEIQDGTPTAHVDHCHATAQLRGLLCGGCNTGIGMMGDDPDKLMKAARYLELFL